MKKINKKYRTILAILGILIMIISYYVFFYNSKMYKEFEETENIKELIPYEEEIQNTEISKDTEKTSDNTIVIHITGSVKNWGIVELPANSRIADAIEKAGGLTDDADINRVNLAYILEDGMKIKIPSINEPIEKNDEEDQYISSDSGDDVIISDTPTRKNTSNIININTATQTELETLPGIGTSTALKIINYRNENGKFQSIEDIKNVSGIGDSKFENIKKLICV